MAKTIDELEFLINEMKKQIDELKTFKYNLINVAGDKVDEAAKNIAEYLVLKDKHHEEIVFLAIASRETLDQIDQEALKKRQEEELKQLFSRISHEEHHLSFPIKKQ